MSDLRNKYLAKVLIANKLITEDVLRTYWPQVTEEKDFGQVLLAASKIDESTYKRVLSYVKQLEEKSVETRSVAAQPAAQPASEGSLERSSDAQPADLKKDKIMKELKTVSFGQDIGLEDSLVTTPVLPEINNELDRNVNILHDVIFEGPVYGNKISVTKGPAEFKKSVYASDEIYIPSGATGDVDFHGAVVSKRSVFAWLASSKARFASDINAPEVKLKNCYVAGSIFAQTVELENCVVLGGIFAKDVSIRNSMFGTLNATTCVMIGSNYMIYPTSFTEEAISYDSTTELWNLSIADLGALFKGDEENPTTGRIRVNLKNTEQKIVLRNDDETTKNVYSYSVASQVVIFDLIKNGSFENHFLLEAAALDNQALKMYNLTKSNGEKSADLNTSNLAEFFFKVLNGQIQVKMADATYSFEEFMKRNR